MATQLWINNLSILIDKDSISEIIIDSSYDTNRNANAFVRFSIVVVFVCLLFKLNQNIMYIFIALIALVTIFAMDAKSTASSVNAISANAISANAVPNQADPVLGAELTAAEQTAAEQTAAEQTAAAPATIVTTNDMLNERKSEYTELSKLHSFESQDQFSKWLFGEKKTFKEQGITTTIPMIQNEYEYYDVDVGDTNYEIF